MSLFDFFRRKRVRGTATVEQRPWTKVSPPAVPQGDERHPALRVLDAYVLDCIGHLSPDESAKIGRLVQQTLGGGDNWKQTVASKVFSGSPDQALKELWSQLQQLHSETGDHVSPEKFARGIVDAQYSHLVHK